MRTHARSLGRTRCTVVRVNALPWILPRKPASALLSCIAAVCFDALEHSMSRQSQSVAVTLNNHTDRAFLDAMSDNDQTAMAKLIEDYFCDDNDSGNVYSLKEKNRQ